MELTPVQSSHIDSVGYLESDGVVLVRYRDGSLHARPGWNAVAYENLMRASSKGKALAACAGPSILIAKGGAEDSQSTRGAPPLAVEGSSAPLNHAPISISEMRKAQKPTSAADCSVAVVK
jgi:hypothetical protein